MLVAKEYSRVCLSCLWLEVLVKKSSRKFKFCEIVGVGVRAVCAISFLLDFTILTNIYREIAVVDIVHDESNL